MTNQTQSQEPSTVHSPRILCPHESEFRFVFVEAPFSSTAGSDVMSVYNQWGPFKRWVRFVRGIDHAIGDEMNRDDLRGATGEWVGLLGFSQGARVAASVLYQPQFQEGTRKPGRIGAERIRFGVLFAGRAHLVWPEDTPSSKSPGLADASFATDTRGAHPEQLVEDEGINLHRQLLELGDTDSRRLVELDLEHRLPFKSGDVAPAVRKIREPVKKTGLGAHSRTA
ncbi:serine hydrolase FSH [Xylaria telfairii]|nr:serine hydrolase FSH [Xylaria telfairii]